MFNGCAEHVDDRNEVCKSPTPHLKHWTTLCIFPLSRGKIQGVEPHELPHNTTNDLCLVERTFPLQRSHKPGDTQRLPCPNPASRSSLRPFQSLLASREGAAAMALSVQ